MKNKKCVPKNIFFALLTYQNPQILLQFERNLSYLVTRRHIKLYKRINILLLNQHFFLTWCLTNDAFVVPVQRSIHPLQSLCAPFAPDGYPTIGNIALRPAAAWVSRSGRSAACSSSTTGPTAPCTASTATARSQRAGGPATECRAPPLGGPERGQRFRIKHYLSQRKRSC